MFALMNKPTAAYSKVAVDVGVETASPHKLILMLYDGALLALFTAKTHIDNENRKGMSDSLTRATDIIAYGLKESLNYNAGAELADKLAALYDYMCDRLQAANLKADKAAIEEVCVLLKELQGAWQEIANDPAVASQTKTAA